MRFKQFFFLSGLPRSGSTALASILSQNPSLYVSPISIMVGLFDSIRKIWETAEHPKVFPVPGQLESVLEGTANGLYFHINQPIVIDKNRAWPHPKNLQTLDHVLNERPKVICTVRNVNAILASFLRIIHKSLMTSFVDKAILNQGGTPTDESRCQFLMSPEGHVFQAWSVLKWGFESEYRDCLHFIEYTDLVDDPRMEIARLYDFLELDLYKHDFNNIENRSQEEDKLYGIPGMHDVRKVLKKEEYSIEGVLGRKLYDQYKGGSFWQS
jgi:sulfotransferase